MWRDIWNKLKAGIRESREIGRKTSCEEKPMQSEIYKGLDMENHKWIECNIDPRKVSAIIDMQEQMVETRAWKKNRGLTTIDECRLCGEQKEGVTHLVTGCKNWQGKNTQSGMIEHCKF